MKTLSVYEEADPYNKRKELCWLWIKLGFCALAIILCITAFFAGRMTYVRP